MNFAPTFDFPPKDDLTSSMGISEAFSLQRERETEREIVEKDADEMQ